MSRKVFTAGMFVALSLLLGAAPAQAQIARRSEIGAQFTTIRIGGLATTEPGVGGRYTYNFTDQFALESEFNFLPRDRANAANGGGGRKVEALFGAKLGLRTPDFGFFGKVRPGFMHFGRVFKCASPASASCPAGSATRFAFDVGGVIEYYPRCCVLLRFDLGDTVIGLGDRTIDTATGPRRVGGGATHNFQFSAGVGFRF